MTNKYKTRRTDWPLVIGVAGAALWVAYLLAKEFIRWTA